MSLISDAIKVEVAANPFAVFMAKYWHVIAIVFLFGIIGTMGWLGWKYHEVTNQKIIDITVQSDEYKSQTVTLQSNIEKIQEDMKAMEISRQNFETALSNVQKTNADLVKKIGALTTKIPPGTTSADAQKTVNEIQNELKNNWSNIQSSQGTNP
jgi:uncharacterized protein YlxW (UPF0749 family)